MSSRKSRSSSKKANKGSEEVTTAISAIGVDVGQGKVLNNPNSWIRLVYYRYTLMTGVYMLDPLEQNFLHFFMILGAFFLTK
jgi:hypothetical protein